MTRKSNSSKSPKSSKSSNSKSNVIPPQPIKDENTNAPVAKKVFSDKEKKEMISISTRWISIRDTSFAGIALWTEGFISQKELTAYTDGKNIYYGDGYFQLSSKEERAAVTVHEILHVALRHIPRTKHRNHRLWNLATDSILNYSINQIDWLKLPDNCVTFDKIVDSQTLSEIHPSKWTSEMVYDYLLEKTKRQLEDLLNQLNTPSSNSGTSDNEGDNNNNSSKNTSSESFDKSKSSKSKSKPGSLEEEIDKLIDEIYKKFPGLKGDLQPSSSSTGGDKENSEIEDEVWRKRVERATAGSKSGSLLREVLKDFPISETPWQKLLQKFMKKACLPRTEENWTRPGRHMLASKSKIYQPSIRQVKGLDKAVIIVDTSGSINDELLNSFASEIQLIQQQTGATINLLYGDVQVAAEYIVKPGGKSFIEKLKAGQYTPKGGGGTDMRVLINRAVELRPPIVIVLTDGYTPFPKPQDIRGLNLIWAMTTDIVAPVGKTIQLKI